MFIVWVSRNFLALTDVNYLAERMNTIKAALEAVKPLPHPVINGQRIPWNDNRSRKTMNSLTSMTFHVTIMALLTSIGFVVASPAIAVGYDPLQICIENCAICKKMLGAWFEGPLCADSCFKFKGKLIPECEDVGSISPFLNKL